MGKRDDGFKDFVLDQLTELRGLSCRAMFGGYGVYRGDLFFGILARGRLYFKTGSESRARYESRGMQPFRPSDRQTLKNYFEVPAEVVEDPDELVAWALEAVQVAAENQFHA